MEALSAVRLKGKSSLAIPKGMISGKRRRLRASTGAAKRASASELHVDKNSSEDSGSSDGDNGFSSDNVVVECELLCGSTSKDKDPVKGKKKIRWVRTRRLKNKAKHCWYCFCTWRAKRSEKVTMEEQKESNFFV